MQNEISPYPCYVFQSPLSKAFNSLKYIEAEVDITKFVPGAGRIQILEELVTSTSEFIQNIRREAFKKLAHIDQQEKRVIKAKPGHDLILRTAGYREYFEGNYQLLQYERVRVALRKKSKIELELTEIPKDYRSKFPPLYKHINRNQDQNQPGANAQS